MEMCPAGWRSGPGRGRGMPTPGRFLPRGRGYVPRAPLRPTVRHAHRGPRTAGGPDRRQLTPVTVPGAKERLLLAVLVAGAPGVTADRLVETLWDGDPPERAEGAPGPPGAAAPSPGARPAQGSTGRYVVRRGHGSASLRRSADIDALRIADLVARPRRAGRRGRRGGAGDFRRLDDCGGASRTPTGRTPPSPRSSGDGSTRSDRSAVSALVEARLALGGHTEVLPEPERLTVEEPLREDWWRLLMLALYRAGRQAEALAAGRRARALLAEERDRPGPVSPMEAAVLAQDPALDLPTGRPSRGPEARRPAPAGACPYKGLASYQVADAALFHGRVAWSQPLVGAARRRAAARGLGQRRGQVLPRPGRPGPATRTALPGQRGVAAGRLYPGRRPVDASRPSPGTTPPRAGRARRATSSRSCGPGRGPAERTAFLDAVLG